jgi:hypothetical protein
MAITADAQRAAAVPTAAPWQRRTRTPPDKPALHLAVLVDVSWSMYYFAAPMYSAGWIRAHATHRNQAIITTIAFGEGRHPARSAPPATHPGARVFVAGPTRFAARCPPARPMRSGCVGRTARSEAIT